MKFKFAHNNFNVLNLEKSLAFYKEALGFTESHCMETPGFTLVYLSDGGQTPHALERTWLKDRKEPYDLGECEFHICMRVPGDYEAARAFHKQMGCVCYENTDMNLYFISDPDGYWIEILPL